MLIIFFGMIIVILFLFYRVSKKYKQKIQYISDNSKKISQYYFVLNDWMMLKQKGGGIADYLRHQNAKRVAIYGMKELGERLYDELQMEKDIEIVCSIDEGADKLITDIPIIKLNDPIPKDIDLVIVTPVFYYREIEKNLKTKMMADIVSLDYIITMQLHRV